MSISNEVGNTFLCHSTNANVGNINCTFNADSKEQLHMKLEVEPWVLSHASSLDSGIVLEHHTFSTNRRDRIFESDEFQRCLQNKGQTVVLEGPIGTGKTTTMLGLIDKLNDMREHGDASSIVITAEIYCRKLPATTTCEEVSTETNKNEESRLLMCILKQILDKVPESGKAVEKLFKRKGVNRQGPKKEEVSSTIIEILEDVGTMNEDASTQRRSTCIFIDALDECPEVPRNRLLGELQKIQEKTCVGLVMTDRLGVSNWKLKFKEHGLRHEVRLMGHPDDMRQYVHTRVSDLKDMGEWKGGDALLEEVVETVVTASRGIFLLVRLYVDCVASDTLADSVRTTLRSIQDSKIDHGTAIEEAIQEAYGWSISRILGPKAQYGGKKRARLALAFARDACRPLSIRELQWLLSINDVNSGAPLGSKDNQILTWAEIQGNCHGLLEGDERNLVHLVHRTLNEYLERRKTPAEFPLAHNELATRCLIHLRNQQELHGHCPDIDTLKERLQRFPLLEYAARYWHVHVRRSTTFQDEEEVKLDTISEYVSKFLRSQDSVEAAFQVTLFPDEILANYMLQRFELSAARTKLSLVFKQGNGQDLLDPFKPNRMNGLHMACEHGFRRMVSEFCKIGKGTFNLDAQNVLGYSALHYAVKGGHRSIVNILISKGANVNVQDVSKTTPLILATVTRNQEIAGIILNKAKWKVEVNIATRHDHNWEEHELEVLLRDGIPELDAIGTTLCTVSGRTALHFAARNGMYQTVDTLLNRRILGGQTKLDIRDSQGQNAFHKAAKYGELKIMKRLIEGGFRATTRIGPKNENGKYVKELKAFEGYENNAMHLAAKYGRTDVVKYLLSSHCGMCNETNAKGRTPLCLSTMYGQIAIMDLILKDNHHGALNQGDKENIRPLHYSMMERSGQSLRILLEMKDVMVNVTDDKRSTPLHWAAIYGVATHVNQLIGRDDVKADVRDTENCTPLVRSALCSNRQTFRELWASKKVRDNVVQDPQALVRVLDEKNISMVIRKEIEAFRDQAFPQGLTITEKPVSGNEGQEQDDDNDQEPATTTQATVEDYDEMNQAEQKGPIISANLTHLDMCIRSTNNRETILDDSRTTLNDAHPTTDVAGVPRSTRLLCPLYFSVPQGCQEQFDDMSAIINHLSCEEPHVLPHYCARCHQRFERESLKDTHNRDDNCERQPAEFEWNGVRASVFKELQAEQYQGLLSEPVVERAWKRLFSAFFPDATPPESPYAKASRPES